MSRLCAILPEDAFSPDFVPDYVPEYMIVHVVYSSFQRTRWSTPTNKVVSIETSTSRARRVARAWTERQQRRYNGSSYVVEDQNYRRETGGKCAMWSTPAPYGDGYVFHAWTRRHIIEAHDITCVWEEEPEVLRLLRLICPEGH
jgi:hypothetical protein